MENYLLKNIDNPNSNDISEYKKVGGYKSLEKAMGMEPGAILEEVKASGLRGRGGAGFPCFMKWNFAKADQKFPKYLLCNADEGEPGTFKDREILDLVPRKVMVGMAICAYVIGAKDIPINR